MLKEIGGHRRACADPGVCSHVHTEKAGHVDIKPPAVAPLWVQLCPTVTLYVVFRGFSIFQGTFVILGTEKANYFLLFKYT